MRRTVPEILAEIKRLAVNASPSEAHAQATLRLTYPVALQMIADLAEKALSLPIASATVLADPAPQSSVQIEGRAKGPPAVTVKVYAADVVEAARLAREQYDALVTLYATPAAE